MTPRAPILLIGIGICLMAVCLPAPLFAEARTRLESTSRRPSVSSSSIAPVSEQEAEIAFADFIERFDRKYATTEEFFHRFRAFKENLAIIRDSNSKNHTYTLGVTVFADLTNEEYKATRRDGKKFWAAMKAKRAQRAEVDPDSVFRPEVSDDEPNPVNVNWVTSGAVTSVKTQGTVCAYSDYAFSTVGAIEGARKIKGYGLTSLSAQQVVDCTGGTWGNNGCNGGNMDNAFEYVISSNPLATDAAYPYTGATESCSVPSGASATISSYIDVSSLNEAALVAAIQTTPVSAAVDADSTIWQHYTTGTITSSTCGTAVDHAVLIVGVNTGATVPYYLVKNSVGTGWGLSGYAQVGYGSNVCGIAEAPSFPKV